MLEICWHYVTPVQNMEMLLESFEDLEGIVRSQGETLDTIDGHIAAAQAHTARRPGSGRGAAVRSVLR